MKYIKEGIDTFGVKEHYYKIAKLARERMIEDIKKDIEMCGCANTV